MNFEEICKIPVKKVLSKRQILNLPKNSIVELEYCRSGGRKRYYVGVGTDIYKILQDGAVGPYVGCIYFIGDLNTVRLVFQADGPA
jgi:hypothetical protein